MARDGVSLMLLYCGGTKKRQHADIATALARHAEYTLCQRASAKKAR